MDKISVIVSCYNEEESLPIFYNELEKVVNTCFEGVLFEYIFVDDGSHDRTLEIMRNLSNIDNKVKYISFSRNFGKEAAMLAGLKESTGDFVTLMDADLQDPPSLLLEMYKMLKSEDYEQICTRRENRSGEPKIRSLFAKMFYKIINKISKVEMVDGARDFRLMTRQVVISILSLSEYNRYSKGLFSFVGFKTKWISYDNIQRAAGKTKWSFWGLFKYALEGITAFSTVPLIISVILGIIFCLISFALLIINLFSSSLASNIYCIVFLVSGIQLFALGIVGQYLAKTYLEVKKRPVYIIREKNEELVRSYNEKN